MPHELDASPFKSFKNWYDIASEKEANHDAFALATCGENNRPSCRYLLLKGFDEKGFNFYTNKNSLKGRQISENPFGEMVFYWRDWGRQIRITGKLEALDRELTASLFAKRAQDSKVATYISQQGQKLESRESLLNDFHAAKEKFKDQEIELPEHWEGYRLVPDCFTFFVYGDFRLNERFCYTLEKGEWTTHLLYP